MVVIGYFVEIGGELQAKDVFVAIEENDKGKVEIYCPTEQHSVADKDYVNECTRITKEQYTEISKGYYTPEDYLI